jgi:hypothetical protein
MRSVIASLLVLSVILLGCSQDTEPESQAEDNNRVTKTTENDRETSQKQDAEFDIDVYIDTVKNPAGKLAGSYLKYSILEGDYKSAIELSCQNNREIAKQDTLAQYVIYGKNNPDWDPQIDFQYYLTRKFIPVAAAFNKIYYIEEIDCQDSCKFEYKTAGPRRFQRIFKTALGEVDADKFMKLVHDTNVPVSERRQFYEDAYEKIAGVVDYMDVIRIAEYDTLIVIREKGEWKVCREGDEVRELFQQN